MNGRGQHTLLGNDVLLSVVFEMIRIYTHPFLAGCGEQACCECSCGDRSGHDDKSDNECGADWNTSNSSPYSSPHKCDWNEAFSQCSGKICMLDFLVNCLFQVVDMYGYDTQDSSCQVVGIYSRSLRMCQYLTRYYRKKQNSVQW